MSYVSVCLHAVMGSMGCIVFQSNKTDFAAVESKFAQVLYLSRILWYMYFT